MKAGFSDSPVAIEIVVQADWRDRMPEVANRLSACGVRVREVADASGTISGFARSGDVIALGRLRGVASVSRATTFEVPPDLELM